MQVGTQEDGEKGNERKREKESRSFRGISASPWLALAEITQACLRGSSAGRPGSPAGPHRRLLYAPGHFLGQRKSALQDFGVDAASADSPPHFDPLRTH